MTALHFLSAYLHFHVLLTVAVVGLATITLVSRLLKRPMSGRAALQMHQAAFFAVVSLCLLQPSLPEPEMFEPVARVWSSESWQDFRQNYAPHEGQVYVNLGAGSAATPVALTSFADVISWGIAGTLFIALAFFWRERWRLRKAMARAHLFRRMGRVRVWVHPDGEIPFSYWAWGRAHVVVPYSLVSKPRELRIVMAHEMQHHRQGDTRLVYGLSAFRMIGFCNPFAYIWSRWLSEIQEFACDEALVDRRRFSAQAYARCLVEVAQNAVQVKNALACAAGFAFHTSRQQLKRRILNMFNQNQRHARRGWLYVGAACLALLMGATTFASSQWVQDRRVSRAQADSLVEKARQDSGLPFIMNEMVLAQLNRFVGTPQGREYMRGALERLETYRDQVEPKLREWGIPLELIAMPIVESAYRNLAQMQSKTAGRAAGLWQFIPLTAKRFDVRVEYGPGGVNSEPVIDERLDVAKISGAAGRYLQLNRAKFNDWWLSVLSFNVGESRVDRAIRELGTRDAWAMIKQGVETDQDYLPRVMAAILIMKNPDLVR